MTMATDFRATAQRGMQMIGSGEISTNQWISLAGGTLLVGAGLKRRGLIGLGMAAIGGRMLYRTVQELRLMGQPRAAHHGVTGPLHGPDEPDDMICSQPVDEASWESFPASDAPATY